MSKFSLVLLAFTFRCLCIAQVVSQASINLPDAPQSQIASLLPKVSGSAMNPEVSSTLPAINPIALQPLAGTRARLTLMTPVTSKSATGSLFQARSEEAIVFRGIVLLPSNTLFEGHVTAKPAGRLLKPGSLFMTFDRLVLPNGSTQEISMHLVTSGSTAVKSDSEGRLHPALSKKRLAIQAGGTALTAKFADDLAELAGGTAVGAGNARAIGAGAAAAFLLLQKGREVKLRPGDALDVEFGYPRHNSPLRTPN